MNGKRVALTILMIGLFSLTACESGKTKNDTTPAVTVTEAVTPTETAAPTEAVTPTAEPTPTEAVTPTAEPTAEPTPTEAVAPTEEPTPIAEPTKSALPENFPTDVELVLEPRYTEQQGKDILSEQAANLSGCTYKETETFAVPQDENFTGAFESTSPEEYKKYRYDKTETYTGENGVKAVIQYLNGEKVYFSYTSEVGHVVEFDGEKYVRVNLNDDTVTKKDSAGREILRAEYYGDDGKLTGVTSTQYDPEGRTTEETRFFYDPDRDVYVLSEGLRYTYDEVGNLTAKEAKTRTNGKEYSYSEKYSYETDAQGRIVARVIERSGEYLERSLFEKSKTLYIYNEDGSVLEVYYSDDSDADPEREGDGQLFVPCDETLALINKGVDAYPHSEEDEILKIGTVEKNADGNYEFTDIWEENTFENGLLIHGLTHIQGWFECTYEYDAAKNCIREYGEDGSDGPFDVRHTYDEKGNLITSVSEEAYDQFFDESLTDEEKHGKLLTVVTTQYTYDEDGNRIGEDKTETYRGKTVYTAKKVFDADGNTVQKEEIRFEDGKETWKLVGEKIQ